MAERLVWVGGGVELEVEFEARDRFGELRFEEGDLMCWDDRDAECDLALWFTILPFWFQAPLIAG